MNDFAMQYTNLDRALDEARPAVQEWSDNQRADGLDDELIHCTCLVLHEWISNLYRHAQFQDCSPRIRIRCSYQDRCISGLVVDNSEGFDLEAHLPEEEENTEPFSEGGNGLRIIRSCTTSLSYTPADEGLHRFEFTIPSDYDPWLNTLF